MRDVVVTVADGEAGVFNKKLSAEAFEKFKVKSSKLPAHITLKAPFETEEPIEVLEEAIEKYIKDKKAIPYEIKGFEHFDNRVIYMNAIENKEMRDFHKGFVKAIKEVNYISFGSHEGENAIFHVTVSSKKVSFVFDEMWQWINQFNCNYNVLLNNISIYKWQDNTWKLHKRFELKE